MSSVDKRVIALMVLFGAGMVNAGTLKLGPLFADHMVVQRDRPVRIGGTAAAGQPVMIRFAGAQISCRSDQAGNWQAELPPMKASFDPLEMEVAAGPDRIVVKDILIGDVWLCSGQSNMDRPVKAFSTMKIDPEKEQHPFVRIISLLQRAEWEPQNNIVIDAAFADSWQECSGEPLQSFSATAFYFGVGLQQELKVPIGLVEGAWGGTRIEPWCSREMLQAAGLLQVAVKEPGKVTGSQASTIYNAMIYPLREFNFKGVIWYQGESNALKGDPLQYRDIFPDMIANWRCLFRQETMPFLFVQLAPFNTGQGSVADAWAVLRESQTKALALPYTGMAVITDAGEYVDIHPQRKQVVGERLVLQALKMDGRDVVADGPLFRQMEIKGERCRINFDHAESGLETRRVVMNRQKDMLPGKDPSAFVVEAGELKGFVVCGEDRCWVEAHARIVSSGTHKSGDFVEVWSDAVAKPVAVRYGWANFPLCNLYNSDGLPASPFRTDLFEIK